MQLMGFENCLPKKEKKRKDFSVEVTCLIFLFFHERYLKGTCWFRYWNQTFLYFVKKKKKFLFICTTTVFDLSNILI